MIRTTGFCIALGGCLLGWEPVADTDVDAAGDADIDADTDTDTECEPVVIPESCGPYDRRFISISRSLTPLIGSDKGFSDIYVYRESELQWHAWSKDERNSLEGVQYGSFVPGLEFADDAIPLEAGVEYAVQLDALCSDDDGCYAVSSGLQAFTARKDR